MNDISPDDFGEITGTADIIDQFPDVMGDTVTVGVHAPSGVVLIGVRHSPAILDGDGRDRFMKAYADAERRAEAHGQVTP